ncbi:MAG TPA: DUF3618 domain-containing protein [Gemmatimonadaceae bacterium]|nr:DUF3618 domain-containing protein [Gemmatimonadaceae bacterium]
MSTATLVRDGSRRGVGMLLRDLAGSGQALAKQEIQLARLQARARAREVGVSAAILVVGALLLLAGLVTAVVGFSLRVSGPWIAQRPWVLGLLVAALAAVIIGAQLWVMRRRASPHDARPTLHHSAAGEPQMAETVGEARREIDATRGQLADTVEELERRFHVREQVVRRPWPVLAVAVGAGYLLAGGARRADRRERAMREEPELRAAPLAESYAAPHFTPPRRAARMMDDVMDTVSSGVKDVVRAGVQALAGELRTALVASLAGAAGATVTRRHAEAQHADAERTQDDGSHVGRQDAPVDRWTERAGAAPRAD